MEFKFRKNANCGAELFQKYLKRFEIFSLFHNFYSPLKAEIQQNDPSKSLNTLKKMKDNTIA